MIWGKGGGYQILRFINFMNATTLEPGTGYQHRCTPLPIHNNLTSCFEAIAKWKPGQNPCPNSFFFQYGHGTGISNKNIQSDELL